MGMKIGKNVVLNTTAISDPCLIEIDSNTTIGGSVTIVAHYGQKGILIIGRVIIGQRVTIGLRAIIMGDVTIGDGAQILPGSVVLPKTVIAPHEVWGGSPACKIIRAASDNPT
jgi:acetyltransferase-like isoleucine patch superfamily enzyme